MIPKPCHGPSSLSLVSHLGSPCLIPGYLHWTKCHWDRLVFEYFSFFLLVSPHQWSVLLIHHLALTLGDHGTALEGFRIHSPLVLHLFVCCLFCFNACWLAAFCYTNPFSGGNIIFDLCLFLFTPTFSGMQIGHKTRSVCKWHLILRHLFGLFLPKYQYFFPVLYTWFGWWWNLDPYFLKGPEKLNQENTGSVKALKCVRNTRKQKKWKLRIFT